MHRQNQCLDFAVQTMFILFQRLDIRLDELLQVVIGFLPQFAVLFQALNDLLVIIPDDHQAFDFLILAVELLVLVLIAFREIKRRNGAFDFLQASFRTCDVTA